MKYTEKQKALEWDVIIWGEALKFWDEEIEKYIEQNSKPLSILEIGSRSGRLSYWLFTRFPGNKITCTDYYWNDNNVIENVKKINSKDFTITMESVTSLTFEDRTFDIVIFKSVLGGLKTLNNQHKAINEIHRVLKANGIMLFAENLQSTKFHQMIRSYNRFPWRYLKYTEFQKLITPFDETKIKTIGFGSLFTQKIFFHRIFAYVDKYLSLLVSERYRYVAYGVSRKKL